MIVLKKPCYATWNSAIITAITTRASSNFLSTHSDACFHPIILIVHVADQDFTRDGHSKFKIQDCFTKSKLWTLPTHSASLEFFSKSSGSLGILYQRTRLHWHSFPSHPDPSKFSTNALGFIGILFQVIRIPRNSLPTHSASCKKVPRRAIRPVRHQAPRRAIRPVGHQAPRRAIPTS